jgi:hypothetical protein
MAGLLGQLAVAPPEVVVEAYAPLVAGGGNRKVVSLAARLAKVWDVGIWGRWAFEAQWEEVGDVQPL